MTALVVCGTANQDKASQMNNSSNSAAPAPNNTWSAEIITAKIREIATTTFGMDLLDSSAPIRSAGLDSLALIDIVMGLEEFFGCQLPLEKLPPNPTVNDFVELVQANQSTS